MVTRFVAVALVAAACGTSSPTETGSDGGASPERSGDGSSSDGSSSGSGSGSSGSGSVSGSAGCGDYYDAVFGGGCSGPILPAAELARQRARFVTECESLLALPDTNLAADAFEACAQQVRADDTCRFRDGGTAQCALDATGSRAAGAPCSAGSQCGSGVCPFAGGSAVSACGACASFVPLGQPCSGSDECATTAGCVGSGSAMCAAITFDAPAGSSCNGVAQATVCGAGLYCSMNTVCTPAGGQGASCAADEQCGAHLYCISGSCQPPREVGAMCPGGAPCDYALLCSSTTMQCTAVTWASAGQPCGGATLCLVGDCEGGTCPQVIPDGQPCSGAVGGPICDAFAQCTSGVCTLAVTSACQ